MNISQRQKEILMAIIDEFMRTAEEVGSTHLVENKDLGVSSATIRSEMVRLMNEGFLEKSHISSGRLPTDQAIRLYVKELVNKPDLSAFDAVQIRQGIFKVRFSQDRLISEILRALVHSTKSAAFIVTDDSSRYYGASSLMKYSELRDLEALERILDVLENTNLLRRVFSMSDGDEVSLLIGNETGIKDLENCSIAFTKVSLWQKTPAHMGVIGSKRMNYAKVFPALNTIRDSVESSLRGWK
jgi:transcriptional regulator of heat shock response